MNNWLFVHFSRIFLLGILIFEGLTARRLYKSFVVNGLKSIFQVSMLSCHSSITGDRLLGPCFIAPRPTEAVYHHFLLNFLLELLQDVNLLCGVHLWFVPDGAPRNFRLAVFRNSGLDVVNQQLDLLVSPGLIANISVSGDI
jgi:hypothetical protein